MDSAIEKITLYDLLGYTVPGLTFLVMASFRWYLQIPVEKLEQYSNYEGYIGVGFLYAVTYVELRYLKQQDFSWKVFFRRKNGSARKRV